MAEFSLGTAALGTEVDLEGLDKGIADAEGKADSGFAKIGNVMGSALKVGIAAAGVAVVAAIGAIGVAALDTASQVNQASNDIQAELGVTEEEANRLGDVALKVWGQNWGDSIDDVKDGIVTVRQQMKGLADEELEGVTAKAFAIRDAFGVDVAESTNAANVLMEKFGLSSTEAFDFIARGFQKGLNNSGDFLETVTEYGVQFSEAGFEADEFFSTLESGQQGFSSLGTDKIADLTKEGRIRIMEMSDDVVNAFQMIGDSQAKALEFGGSTRGIEALDLLKQKAAELGVEVDENLSTSVEQGAINFSEAFSSLVLGAVEDGTISVADAQQIAISGLRDMENQVWQNTAGVAIFGTQWEDLGASAVLSLDTSTTSLEDMAGATDSLNAKYDNWPALWEGIKRSALVAIEPLGAKLLELANDVMPVVQIGFDWLQNDLPPIIETVVGVIDTAVATISGLLNGPLAGSLTENAGFFQTTFTQISEIVSAVAGIVMTALGQLAGFIQAHGTEIRLVLSAAWQVIQSLITGALALIQGVVKTTLALMRGDFSGAWTAIQQMSATFVQSLLGVIKGGLDIIAGIFGTTVDDIIATWRGIASQASDLGGNIIQGIISGVRGASGQLVSIMVEMAKDAWEAVKAFFGISSPSKLFERSVGEPLIEGIIVGAKSMIPELGSVIQTVGDVMRSKVKKMTEEIADEIQKTVEDLQKKAEEVEDAITAAMIGGFGADADIARLKARNLDAVAELGEASRAEAQKQLDLAAQMAAEFSDPEQAAAFFKERSQQILELAELQDELAEAETDADKARLQKKIDLIKLAQQAEREALSLQEPDTALSGVIEALEGFLMDDSVRENLGGILDDPTGMLRGLTDLLGQLRGANTTPDYTAGGMVFNIDARGATMSQAEYEASMRKVLNETGRSADWRRRTGGS